MTSGNYAYECHELKETGNLARAMASCNKAIEMDPKNDAAYYYRGNVRSAQADFDGAIADYDIAIKLDPKNENAYYNRGMARINNGDFDNAIADYTRYIELDSTLAEAYYNRGLAKEKKRDYENAIADYTKAIELEPELSEAYLSRGNAKNEKGDRAGAIADYSEALNRDPKSAAAYAAKAYLLYDSRDWSAALTNLRAAIANGSGNEDYERLRIFLVRSRLGENEPAMKELDQYLTRRKTGKPGDWFSTIVRFLTHKISEEAFLASAERGNKQTIQEQTCEAYFYAGTLRVLKDDKVKAREYFQRSVDTNVTNFTEYVSAKAELELLK